MANIGNLTTFYSAQTPQISVTDISPPIGITAVNFKQQTQTKITQTASGRSVRVSNATTLWGGSIEFSPMTQSQAKQMSGFLSKARGPLNDFYVVIPGASEFHGVANNAPVFTVNGAFAAGSTSISVTGTAGTGSIAGTYWPPGMVIRFASHDKVYMVTNDVNNLVWSTTSNKTVTIEPPLVSAITTTSVIEYDNVPFKVFATSDLQEYQYTNDGLVGYRIDVQETI